MEKELRSLGEKVELRKDDNGDSYAEGYAIIFNQESRDLGGFVEVIDPASISGADLTDIMGRYNHQVLIGRSTSGTLTYSIDERGVKYSIKLPKSPSGEDLRELLDRGDVTGSSFAFRTKKDKWEEVTGQRARRTILQFEGVYDMGPVDSPAYTQTSAALRSLEEARNEKKESFIEIRINGQEPQTFDRNYTITATLDGEDKILWKGGQIEINFKEARKKKTATYLRLIDMAEAI